MTIESYEADAMLHLRKAHDALCQIREADRFTPHLNFQESVVECVMDAVEAHIKEIRKQHARSLIDRVVQECREKPQPELIPIQLEHKKANLDDLFRLAYRSRDVRCTCGEWLRGQKTITEHWNQGHMMELITIYGDGRHDTN